jgi:hypothetical protein
MGNFLVAIDRSEGKAGPAIFVMTEQEYNEVSQLWHDNPSCVSKDGELMFDDRYGFEIYGYTTLQAAVESVKALDDYDELLKNNEGPKYVAMASKGIIDKFIGLKVKKATAAQADAVTGATFTSNALIANINAGLNYYLKNK